MRRVAGRGGALLAGRANAGWLAGTPPSHPHFKPGTYAAHLLLLCRVVKFNNVNVSLLRLLGLLCILLRASSRGAAWHAPAQPARHPLMAACCALHRTLLGPSWSAEPVSIWWRPEENGAACLQVLTIFIESNQEDEDTTVVQVQEAGRMPRLRTGSEAEAACNPARERAGGA